MIYLSYLATALVLAAVYYISKPLLRGQYLIVTADLAWLVYGTLTAQWALAIQSVILLSIGISAISNWKAKGIPV